MTSQSYEATKSQFDLIFRIQLVAILVSWGVVASYLVYLFKTNYVPSEKKALWAVVIFLGNVFAMPVFWYLYVWRPIGSRGNGA